MLTGALKHHLKGPDPMRLYKEAGGNPDNYDWQLASLGRPLGLEQMLVDSDLIRPLGFRYAGTSTDTTRSVASPR